ncbi:hypothetical protein AZL_e00310 (plasmid) [Azospirillum sp. B510]|nr:hypothetical protein AZL_e00310 [Azospirillum sp. B510]
MERSWGCQRLVRTPIPPLLRVGEFTETAGRFHRSARALSAVPAGCFPPKYAAADTVSEMDRPHPSEKRRTRDAAQRDRRRAERKDERLALYDLYRASVADQEERLRSDRRMAWEAQRASERARRAALQTDQQDRRLELRGIHLPLVKRQAWTEMLAAVAAEECAALTATFQGERQALRHRFGALQRTGWTDFLQERAAAGDRAAQAALRGIRYRTRRADPAITTAPDPSPQPTQTDAVQPEGAVRAKPSRRDPEPVRNGARRIDAILHPPLEARPLPSAPPLSRTARYKCQILDDHYGHAIDRAIGEVIHYVRLPRSQDEPLQVRLTSDEVLTDHGDLITVVSPDTLTGDAVTVFVAMVQAAKWPAVELFGSDEWIAAATSALDAAGILNWPEGQQPKMAPAAARPDEPSSRPPLPSPPMDMSEPVEPAPEVLETTAIPNAVAWDSILGNEELEADPPQVGTKTSPPPPVSSQRLPASIVDPVDAKSRTRTAIERLRDAVLGKKHLPLGPVNAPLDAQLRRPAPPPSRTQIHIETWLAQARQMQAAPTRESIHEHGNGTDDDRTGAGDRQQADRPDGAADCRPDPASDVPPITGQRRGRDPAAAGPDRRSADAARRERGPSEREPDRYPVAPAITGMTEPAAALPALPARPLPTLEPKFQPPWIFSQYIKHLGQWRDRKLRRASAAAVIQSLPLVRKAVEERGLASSATDGPELVDAFVVAILIRIDPGLLETHTAVLALVQEHQVTAVGNNPSLTEQSERTRSAGRPHGHDR